jgi:hypothetical protein
VGFDLRTQSSEWPRPTPLTALPMLLDTEEIERNITFYSENRMKKKTTDEK